MVKKGSEASPLMRCKACTSSLLLTVFSVKGTPRLVSMDLAATQGPQSLPTYSVTGYLDVTCRNSNGNNGLIGELPPPVLGVVTLALLSLGGLSEKVTLPSAPTIR